MKILNTKLKGVFCVESDFHTDNRGSFSRLFCKKDLEDVIKQRCIVQVNYSYTKLKGMIRGMHFQLQPHAEMKFVRCTKGHILDVVVDLRKNSPSFLKWHAEELSNINNKMIIIPEGCAHGFQTLENNCELLYMHTEYYAPKSERGFSYDDPLIRISWPLPITGISDKDKNHPKLEINFSGI